MRLGLSIAHHAGAKGAKFNGFNEFDFSTEFVYEVVSVLKNSGVEIFIAPTGRLRSKVIDINNSKCDLAIEIHFNACGDCGASGSEVLYYPNSTKGKIAASIFQDSIIASTGVRDRGIKEGWYKMDRPNVVDYDGDVDGDEKIDYFLAKTRCTAIILEPEFIEKTSRIILNKNKICEAIAKAVLEYSYTIDS